MHWLGTTTRAATSRTARRGATGGARSLVAAAAALLALSACTANRDPSNGSSSDTPAGGATTATPPQSGTSSPPTVSTAVITTSPTTTTGISPADRVSVAISRGSLTTVTMTNAAGKAVSGALAAGGSTWRSTEDLGYGKTYRITATGKDADGAPVTKHVSYTTLTPDNMTMPYFTTVAGTSIVNGATYGVGMVVHVHFDEQVDRAAAERTLSVTTSPAVTGGWYWDDDENVYWRPQTYYAPGTTVTMAANVYGKRVGSGLYGQADQSVSFKIGAKHVSVADAKSHHVQVYFDDKLQRSMPTSMGRGGTTQGKNGHTIYLWTMPGTYTVLTHENPAIMSSDSYGLPANSPLGYGKEKVYWSTKISTDGIYLHELDTTVWAQGHRNVSHGCLNLNHDNAKWYYENSRVGDIVQVIHSGGPALKFWQGGQWSVPWAQWVQGSALH